MDPRLWGSPSRPIPGRFLFLWEEEVVVVKNPAVLRKEDDQREDLRDPLREAKENSLQGLEEKVRVFLPELVHLISRLLEDRLLEPDRINVKGSFLKMPGVHRMFRVCLLPVMPFALQEHHIAEVWDHLLQALRFREAGQECMPRNMQKK